MITWTRCLLETFLGRFFLDHFWWSSFWSSKSEVHQPKNFCYFPFCYPLLKRFPKIVHQFELTETRFQSLVASLWDRNVNINSLDTIRNQNCKLTHKHTLGPPSRRRVNPTVTEANKREKSSWTHRHTGGLNCLHFRYPSNWMKRNTQTYLGVQNKNNPRTFWRGTGKAEIRIRRLQTGHISRSKAMSRFTRRAFGVQVLHFVLSGQPSVRPEIKPYF